MTFLNVIEEDEIRNTTSKKEQKKFHQQQSDFLQPSKPLELTESNLKKFNDVKKVRTQLMTLIVKINVTEKRDLNWVPQTTSI